MLKPIFLSMRLAVFCVYVAPLRASSGSFVLYYFLLLSVEPTHKRRTLSLSFSSASTQQWIYILCVNFFHKISHQRICSMYPAKRERTRGLIKLSAAAHKSGLYLIWERLCQFLTRETLSWSCRSEIIADWGVEPTNIELTCAAKQFPPARGGNYLIFAYLIMHANYTNCSAYQWLIWLLLCPLGDLNSEQTLLMQRH